MGGGAGDAENVGRWGVEKGAGDVVFSDDTAERVRLPIGHENRKISNQFCTYTG